MKLITRALIGTLSGAAATTMLNNTTYLDQFVRGRPDSSVPAKTAQQLAKAHLLPLVPTEPTTPKLKARQDAAGAMLGIATGLTVGSLAGIASPLLNKLPLFSAASLLSLTAMAGGDVVPAALGITNIKKWTASDWASTAIPHFVYGLTLAWAIRKLD